MSYKKSVCSRCGCGVVALENEIRPLCVDCARIENFSNKSIQKSLSWKGDAYCFHEDHKLWG